MWGKRTIWKFSFILNSALVVSKPSRSETYLRWLARPPSKARHFELETEKGPNNNSNQLGYLNELLDPFVDLANLKFWVKRKLPIFLNPTQLTKSISKTSSNRTKFIWLWAYFEGIIGTFKNCLSKFQESNLSKRLEKTSPVEVV